MFIRHILLLLLSVWCPFTMTSDSEKEYKPPSTTPNMDSLVGNRESGLKKIGQHGNKNYFMNSGNEASFFEATQYCELMHMRLPTIESKEENDALYNFLRSYTGMFWTSGASFVGRHQWLWMSTMEAIGYTNWGQHQGIYEPNNLTYESCIELNSNIGYYGTDGLYWNDRDCTHSLEVICEQDTTEDHSAKAYKKERLETLLHSLESTTELGNVPVLNIRDNIYFVGNHHKVSFLEAAQICTMLDMHLVKIDSAEENSGLGSYLLNYIGAHGDFWTSGSKLLDDTTWIWMSNAQPVTYTNWQPEEEREAPPTNSLDYYDWHYSSGYSARRYYGSSTDSENCIRVTIKGLGNLLWQPVDCRTNNYYICERDIVQ